MSDPQHPENPADLGTGRDAELTETAIETLEHGVGGPPPERHPGGLYVLFFTEMWERFSFYGMKAFLILFMYATIAEGGLGWHEPGDPSTYLPICGAVLGWYAGLVYLTPVIGGWLADRFLGTHWSMVIGGIIIAMGHFTLAAMDLFEHGSTETKAVFFTGLGLIVVGTGFFKPCVSVMVGQLYPDQPKRRDAAFTIFYMGINLGAFLGPIICGGLRVSQTEAATGVQGWSWAFGAAGVGMVLGLIVYAIGRPFLLKGIGLRPERHATGGTAGGERIPLSWEEKERVGAIFILAFFVIFFWTAFEQAGGSMNAFAEERTDRSLTAGFAEWLVRFGNDPSYGFPWWGLLLAGGGLMATWFFIEFPSGLADRSRITGFIGRFLGLAIGASALLIGVLKGTGFLGELFFPESMLANPVYPTEWFQSVNPLCIILLAPLFASLWLWLGKRDREPSTPVKFSLGLILLGLGFIFMVIGAQASQSGAEGEVVRVSGWFLVGAYAVFTCGELCLSPVGLSAVTKLAPTHLVSLLMGVWFTANFVSNLAAGYLTGLNPAISNANFILDGQAGFFLIFVIVPILAGIVLLFLAPKLVKYMHGRA